MWGLKMRAQNLKWITSDPIFFFFTSKLANFFRAGGRARPGGDLHHWSLTRYLQLNKSHLIWSNIFLDVSIFTKSQKNWLKTLRTWKGPSDAQRAPTSKCPSWEHLHPLSLWKMFINSKCLWKGLNIWSQPPPPCSKFQPCSRSGYPDFSNWNF